SRASSGSLDDPEPSGLARVLLLLAGFGKEGKPAAVNPKMGLRVHSSLINVVLHDWAPRHRISSICPARQDQRKSSRESGFAGLIRGRTPIPVSVQYWTDFTSRTLLAVSVHS